MTKPLRLGIIGAENSHSFKIAEICNLQKKVPLRVTHIWGETSELAQIAAQKGGISTIVENWQDIADEVDGIMIDHRNGNEHSEVASYFIKAGIPCFVDKPITCSLKEAKELFEQAEARSCPLTTFSSKPLQKVFQDQIKEIDPATVLFFNSSGPSDLESSYGGVFFYAIHQVDCAVEVFGIDAISANLHVSGPNAVASIEFTNGRMATLNLIKSHSAGFHWRFCTDHGDFSLPDKNDTVPYLHTAELLASFIKTGSSPFTRERMLAPIAILEALQDSYKKGIRVKVCEL